MRFSLFAITVKIISLQLLCQKMGNSVENLVIELNLGKNKNDIIEFKEQLKKLKIEKNFKYTKYMTDNMILLYHDSNFDNDIIQKNNTVIFDIQTLNPIVTFYNSPMVDNDAIDTISKSDWNNIIINKITLDCIHVCLFWHINNWFLSYDNKIQNINNSNDQTINIFKNLINYNFDDNCEKISIFDDKLSYHFLLRHNNFRKLGILDNSSSVTLLYVCDKLLKLTDCPIIENIQPEKKYYFSCLDELQTSLEIINDTDVAHKILSCCGYYVRILSNDKTSYINCILRTNIYKYIISVLPRRTNMYINYLELYQKNILGDILPYLHKYSSSVTKRINISIKTLSKEILNIYHLTRQKQNTILYECLSQNYKKVLYDLHKIYVNQKYGDYIVISAEILKEKKSVSVDIVYNYMKLLTADELLQLFNDRKTLICDLNSKKYDYDKILIVNNIDIIAQMELMNI